MAGPATRVSRVVMTGPLAPFVGVYELELRRRRCTPLTVVKQLRQVARLSHWLETNGLAVAELTGDRVEEFLAFQRASGPAGVTALSGRVRACCACWMCCGGWGWRRSRSRRRRVHPRRWCWRRSSATCWPSAPWRPAPSGCVKVSRPHFDRAQ
jgi:hypothetical protein